MDRRILVFMASLLLCLGGGWLTGWLTESSVHTWYPQLTKPPGTPPDLAFPIIWSILYVLMAISLTLLITAPTRDKTQALALFFVQLILNFAWSFFFFYLQRPDLALIDILLLWIAIIFTISAFQKHTAFGATLLLPYLLWVTFAVYLNLTIWRLN